jgi:hypothetical protein
MTSRSARPAVRHSLCTRRLQRSKYLEIVHSWTITVATLPINWAERISAFFMWRALRDSLSRKCRAAWPILGAKRGPLRV